MFACKMYSPAMSHADCNQRVDTVLASVGLEGCQHTKVGSGCGSSRFRLCYVFDSGT